MRAFDELPLVPGTEERHTWDEWGDGDEFGSLNRITPEKIVRAARCVRKGRAFALTLPLDIPNAAPGFRPVYTHHVLKERNGRDDSLDGFYMSASSQWDGLRHVRFRQHGYYGGRGEEELDETNVLGIDRVGARGIVTRAVLIDIPRFVESGGAQWEPRRRTKITAGMLDDCLAWERTELEEGDIVLLRTGWLSAWTAAGESVRAAGMGENPGLDPDRSSAAWLWDHGVAAIASDNMAVEPMPLRPREEGFLHYKIIPLLGMMMGEQFDLDPLAEDSAADGVYESMLTSAPLRVQGGVCSPPNAIAIK